MFSTSPPTPAQLAAEATAHLQSGRPREAARLLKLALKAGLPPAPIDMRLPA